MTTVDGRRSEAMNPILDPQAPMPASAEPGGRVALQSRIKDILPEMAVPALLVLTFVIFGILKPDLFLTWTNVRLTIGAQATTLLLAIAATITLRAGDFDLSLAGVMIFSAALVGVLYKDGVPAYLACLIALACGTAVGLMNSVFVVLVGLDSLIVSLGMFTLLGGITTYLTNSNLVTTIPIGLQKFANHQILELPLTVWVGWALAAVLWVVFEYTPLGRYLLFIGGNRAAGTLAGLQVNRLRLISFVSGSFIAAVAGLLLAGSLGSVDPSSSSSYLLAPVTAAFLGTTCIQLGRFNIVGTLVGLYLLAFGITGLQLLGLQGWVTNVFNGAALILALAFSRYFEAIRSGQMTLRRRARTA
ncbi:MAG: ribose transport system permease protein [Mycobacterium sp.]|jgi:ribose transport system permease protein|nr:ribose transport system permease protein [Mycobacterium sp.]